LRSDQAKESHAPLDVIAEDPIVSMPTGLDPMSALLLREYAIDEEEEYEP
tara:strand:- start:346 stop:495 length:150 start_codon:yes stop_codon:yes gene_type:complete